MRASPSDPVATDEELAERIARRQDSDRAWGLAQEACGELYARHARRLLAFLAARIGRSDLEDVHQAVWQRVWQSLPDGFRGGNFRAWLYQIARNHLIDLGRKRRTEALEGESGLAAPHGRGPEEVLLERERMAVLARCLDKLGEPARGIVQARLAGASYTEICERLQLLPERAHKLFHLAKEQLQECVQRAMT